MRWRFWDSDPVAEASARARAEHSAWLTRALTQGLRYPRIPIRPMDPQTGEGGFGPMMKRPTGPARAERWWKSALERVDDPPRHNWSIDQEPE
jgi:hypothetical protein